MSKALLDAIQLEQCRVILLAMRLDWSLAVPNGTPMKPEPMRRAEPNMGHWRPPNAYSALRMEGCMRLLTVTGPVQSDAMPPARTSQSKIPSIIPQPLGG